MRRARHRRLRGTAFVLRAVALAAVLYAAGFLVFVVTLPDPASIAPEDAVGDAIVVLTGEGLRLPIAVELLERGAGRRLLISGVNPATNKEELRTLLGGGPAFDCCTDLGFEAGDTRGNAVETANWARMRGYESLVVVTGYDHMPRSLLELSAEMPEIELIPYPVGQAAGNGLIGERLPRLNGEYVKYLASWLRISLTARAAS